MSTHRQGHGIYGLRLDGLDAPGQVLRPAAPGWPVLVVEREGIDEHRRPTDLVPAELRFDDVRGELWFSEKERFEVDRDPLRVRFRTERRLSDELVAHPYVALAAAVANRWLGRAMLHGGAVVVGDVAWGILGDKEGGKSSTLAAFHAAGFPVLSDDLLAVEGDQVYAGPRSIDLREAAADRLGGEPLDVGTGRARWRVRPGEVPSSCRLGGLIHLEWGDEVALDPVPPVERLLRLVASNVFGTGVGDAVVHLDLAALPTYRYARPHDVERIDDDVTRLLDVIS